MKYRYKLETGVHIGPNGKELEEGTIFVSHDPDLCTKLVNKFTKLGIVEDQNPREAWKDVTAEFEDAEEANVTILFEARGRYHVLGAGSDKPQNTDPLTKAEVRQWIAAEEE